MPTFVLEVKKLALLSVAVGLPISFISSGLRTPYIARICRYARLAIEQYNGNHGENLELMDIVKCNCQMACPVNYFLKCSVKKNQLYVQVGDPVADHACWMRPENMKTPRTLYKISKNMPGTEIAAETAATLAASSMVFKKIDYGYSCRLINKAKLLFEFAKQSKGTYDGECPFYCSFSGYNDELLWASSWLYLATKKTAYKNFISYEAISSSVAEFSWDLKFAGAQVLLSNKNLTAQGGLQNFKTHADNFVCQILPDTPFRTIRITPGSILLSTLR